MGGGSIMVCFMMIRAYIGVVQVIAEGDIGKCCVVRYITNGIICFGK